MSTNTFRIWFQLVFGVGPGGVAELKLRVPVYGTVQNNRD